MPRRGGQVILPVAGVLRVKRGRILGNGKVTGQGIVRQGMLLQLKILQPHGRKSQKFQLYVQHGLKIEVGVAARAVGIGGPNLFHPVPILHPLLLNEIILEKAADQVGFVRLKGGIEIFIHRHPADQHQGVAGQVPVSRQQGGRAQYLKFHFVLDPAMMSNVRVRRFFHVPPLRNICDRNTAHRQHAEGMGKGVIFKFILAGIQGAGGQAAAVRQVGGQQAAAVHLLHLGRSLHHLGHLIRAIGDGAVAPVDISVFLD